MNKWTRPCCYCGASWPEWYVFLWQNRDSDAVTRSNFRVGLERLGGESDTVKVIREKHWTVGWVEWIGIHESAADKVLLADEMLDSLSDYPVLSDDDWGDLEATEVMAYWGRMGIRERMEWCQRSGVSVFVARREYDLPCELWQRLAAA